MDNSKQYKIQVYTIVNFLSECFLGRTSSKYSVYTCFIVKCDVTVIMQAAVSVTKVCGTSVCLSNVL